MNIELIEQEGELFLYVPSNKRFAEIKELLSKDVYKRQLLMYTSIDF